MAKHTHERVALIFMYARSFLAKETHTTYIIIYIYFDGDACLLTIDKRDVPIVDLTLRRDCSTSFIRDTLYIYTVHKKRNCGALDIKKL